MGCDIHLFVEHRRKEKLAEADTRPWESISRGKFSDRIYCVFAKLAGVRNNFGITPISEPRGLPDDASYTAIDSYTLIVNDKYSEEDGYCSTENANRWVENGKSRWIGDDRISGPDWHSESWLTPEEFEEAINDVFFDTGEWLGEFWVYKAIAAMMKDLQESGRECRAVFWFDN